MVVISKSNRGAGLNRGECVLMINKEEVCGMGMMRWNGARVKFIGMVDVRGPQPQANCWRVGVDDGFVHGMDGVEVNQHSIATHMNNNENVVI